MSAPKQQKDLLISSDFKLTSENYTHSVLQFRDRQAGVGEVYDPENERYTYNAYCIEVTLLTELYSCEFEFLADALQVIHDEFGQWELIDLGGKSGCGSCVAKGVH
jgi:hypothetical protein